MSRSLEGMSVAITGGGSGIGAGAAQHYAARGARVTICGRRKEKIDAIAADIGPICLAVQADITDETDCSRIVEACLERYGRIDVLHNNVGIGRGDGGPTGMTLEVWNQIFNTNLF